MSRRHDVHDRLHSSSRELLRLRRDEISIVAGDDGDDGGGGAAAAVRRGEHVPAIVEERSGNEDPTTETGLRSTLERDHGGIRESRGANVEQLRFLQRRHGERLARQDPRRRHPALGERSSIFDQFLSLYRAAFRTRKIEPDSNPIFFPSPVNPVRRHKCEYQRRYGIHGGRLEDPGRSFEIQVSISRERGRDRDHSHRSPTKEIRRTIGPFERICKF